MLLKFLEVISYFCEGNFASKFSIVFPGNGFSKTIILFS